MYKYKYIVFALVAVAALAGLDALVSGCGDGETGPPTMQPPRNLTGTYDGTKIILTWQASEGNQETGYQIWVLDPTVGLEYTKKAEVPAGTLTFEDTKVLEDLIYKYKVCTVYDGEQGPFSNEVEVDTSGGNGGTTAYLWVADKDGANITRVKAEDGSVNRTFASPGNKPAGLAWDGSNLWHADFGTGKVYKLNPTSGAVESSFNAPGSGPWGLTWDGSNLWLSDYDTLTIYKLSTSGGVVTSFAAPGTKPRGLAWDGTNLWCTDNGTNKIYKLNPSNGSVISSFNTPGNGTTGLTYGGNNLWNADKGSKKIYKLNPSNGSVISSFNSPGTFPMGLAYQEE